MTRLLNEPAAFADEFVAGFVAANSNRVRSVPGGVVRVSGAESRVAVVVGGGSGHYPAFAGLVGEGLAAAAVTGNVFASPSTQQIMSVAREAEGGAGVLFSYGNYAGDVLNFDLAQSRLRESGLECATVVVTDDVSSAGVDDRGRRRGIAGDLVVFKVAGAASERGMPLAEVARVAALANDRIRTLGVAFTGCTLPGAAEPLFSVPEGRMAIGMGIHGEPGIGEMDVPSADGVAELLVSRLLEETPEGVDRNGARVVPVLNGLGSLKYEELFVVYGRVHRLLAEAGLDVADPQVGEFCTSFDMAGLSLTLFWPDAELESLWTAPADAPAFRRGGVAAAPVPTSAPSRRRPERAPVPSPQASSASRQAVPGVVAALSAITRVIDAESEELGRIDAVAGDGDHGIGMQRGARAAFEAAQRAASNAGAGDVLRAAAEAWSDRAGGTSGVLWGVMLRAVADAIGSGEAPTASSVAAGVAAARRDVMAFGKAEVGDKTLVDALVPFADELGRRVAAGDRLAAAWDAAARAARDAARATADLLPRMGRARPHAERSLGTPDAGAHSLALIVTAITPTLEKEHTP